MIFFISFIDINIFFLFYFFFFSIFVLFNLFIHIYVTGSGILGLMEVHG